MISKNDPRLTDFVLGELEPSEAAEVSAAIEDSSELQQAVAEIERASQLLGAVFEAEPKLRLDDLRRKQLLEAANEEPLVHTQPRTGAPAGWLPRVDSRWWLVSAAALMGILVGGTLYLGDWNLVNAPLADATSSTNDRALLESSNSDKSAGSGELIEFKTDKSAKSIVDSRNEPSGQAKAEVDSADVDLAVVQFADRDTTLPSSQVLVERGVAANRQRSPSSRQQQKRVAKSAMVPERPDRETLEAAEDLDRKIAAVPNPLQVAGDDAEYTVEPGKWIPKDGLPKPKNGPPKDGLRIARGGDAGETEVDPRSGKVPGIQSTPDNGQGMGSGISLAETVPAAVENADSALPESLLNSSASRYVIDETTKLLAETDLRALKLNVATRTETAVREVERPMLTYRKQNRVGLQLNEDGSSKQEKILKIQPETVWVKEVANFRYVRPIVDMAEADADELVQRLTDQIDPNGDHYLTLEQLIGVKGIIQLADRHRQSQAMPVESPLPEMNQLAGGFSTGVKLLEQPAQKASVELMRVLQDQVQPWGDLNRSAPEAGEPEQNGMMSQADRSPKKADRNADQKAIRRAVRPTKSAESDALAQRPAVTGSVPQKGGNDLMKGKTAQPDGSTQPANTDNLGGASPPSRDGKELELGKLESQQMEQMGGRNQVGDAQDQWNRQREVARALAIQPMAPRSIREIDFSDLIATLKRSLAKRNRRVRSAYAARQSEVADQESQADEASDSKATPAEKTPDAGKGGQ